jgi:hypothetical protein
MPAQGAEQDGPGPHPREQEDDMTLSHRTMQAIRNSISETRIAEVELSEAERDALLSEAEGSCYLAPEREDVDGETVELSPARWDVWGTLGGEDYRLTVTLA